MGIGVGNSTYEVGIFKKRYNIPFPLISDADFAAYDRIGGEVRTPYFIAVQISRDGTGRVIYSKLGALGDVEAFLQLIIKSAGL
jgi:peroxiredoxin